MQNVTPPNAFFTNLFWEKTRFCFFNDLNSECYFLSCIFFCVVRLHVCLVVFLCGRQGAKIQELILVTHKQATSYSVWKTVSDNFDRKHNFAYTVTAVDMKTAFHIHHYTYSRWRLTINTLFSSKLNTPEESLMAKINKNFTDALFHLHWQQKLHMIHLQRCTLIYIIGFLKQNICTLFVKLISCES